MVFRLVALCLVWLAACSFPGYTLEDSESAVEASCRDGLRTGDETGIDCGMLACSKPCPAGQGCSGDVDCDGGRCEDQVCRAPSCEDDLENGAESDTDCGGAEGCDRCTVGMRCGALADCDGGQCTSGQCEAPTCKDELLNALETDTDCGGGSCATCGAGQACEENDDCDTGVCRNLLCRAPPCTDGVANQDETDIDCGGSCQPCDDELKCSVADDCASGVCPGKTRQCAVPACDDDVMNGSEPSKDCGGDCPNQCTLLDACSEDRDCDTDRCLDERCMPLTATGAELSLAGWTATASNTLHPESEKNALDGNPSSDWTSGTDQELGMWFQIDMQQARVFWSIYVDCLETPMDAPAGFDVWLSTDGTFDEPTLKNVDGGQTADIVFSQPQAARYIRLSLSRITPTRWWTIDEIRVRK